MAKKKQVEPIGEQGPLEPAPPLSPKQLAAKRQLHALFLNGCILDTETTGLARPGDEPEKPYGDTITEIAAVRASDGHVLFHSYVKPLTEFHPKAQKKMEEAQFPFAELSNAPSFADVLPKLGEALHGFVKSAWNSEFDHRVIEQSAAAAGFGIDSNEPIPCGLESRLRWSSMGQSELRWGIGPIADLMITYARYRGKSARQSLEGSIEKEGLSYQGVAHNAIADCKATADLLRHLLMGQLPEEALREANSFVATNRSLRALGLVPAINLERRAQWYEEKGFHEAASVVRGLL
jgi:DNA polymerase III epsilon subunit-like protein